MSAVTTKSKPADSTKKAKSAPPPQTAQLDILFSGPLLFVPAVNNSNITGVEVYSPGNGHPVGAVFLPGIFFSDAELNDPQCERWPASDSFSLLDPHGYSIDITQQHPANSAISPFPVSAIPDSNHKVRPGRRLSGDWQLAFAVNGDLTAWTSHRLLDITDDAFHGADAPASGQVAITHRLSYKNVIAAEFCGASREPREYLRSNISKGGTLIVLGEIPYQSTLLHERQAISALAKLAGLDLHLAALTPVGNRARQLGHHLPCGFSIIVV
jgi:hypothetical protein